MWERLATGLPMADLDLEARQATAAAPGDFQMPFQASAGQSWVATAQWAGFWVISESLTGRGLTFS